MITYGKTLKDVRRELVKAKLADAVTVQLTLNNFWRPMMWVRGFKFIFKNRRRQRVLQRMSDKSMGFAWRSSMPKKKQREMGYLPKLT